MDIESAQRILENDPFIGSKELLDAVEFLMDTLGIEKYDALYRALVEKSSPMKLRCIMYEIRDYIHDHGSATTIELVHHFGVKKNSLCTKLSMNPTFVSKRRRWMLASDG